MSKQRRGQWPRAVTQQEGDRISVISSDGDSWDTRDIAAVEVPDWDHQNHCWVTAICHVDANPWDATRLFDERTMFQADTHCFYCKKPWAEDTDLACLGPAAAPNPEGRLEVIAEAHSKHVASGGMTSGLCNECGNSWPCPTYAWATTEHRNAATDPFDPADDEV